MNKEKTKPDRYGVMAIADLCLDVVVSSQSRPEFGQVELLASGYELDLGGSVGIFATQFAKLGGNIALIGAIGNDQAGRIVADKLNGSGVDPRYIFSTHREKTALGLNIAVGDDRAMLAYPGTMELMGPEIWDDNWLGICKHWHIASYFLLQRLIPVWPEWVRRLKSEGVTISLDTNWAPEGNWEDVLQLLPLVDVFLPNLAEALAITGKETLADAGNQLSAITPMVVVKCGAEGAAIFKDGTMEMFPVPQHLTRSLVIADTTGAGDNFDAGFIHSWLQGNALEACVTAGCRCAVSSLKEYGGITGQIDLRPIKI